jgi:hypothetical protein
MTKLDPEDIADQALPLGGPYDPEAVIAAARTISELVRRLNHATFHAEAFTYPSDVNRLVGVIAGGVAGLPQLFGQIARHMHAFAADPRLTVAPASENATPAHMATTAASWLTSEAAASISRLTHALQNVQRYTSRLGIDESGWTHRAAGAAFPSHPAALDPADMPPSTAALPASNPTTPGPAGRRTR